MRLELGGAGALGLRVQACTLGHLARLFSLEAGDEEFGLGLELLRRAVALHLLVALEVTQCLFVPAQLAAGAVQAVPHPDQGGARVAGLNIDEQSFE